MEKKLLYFLRHGESVYNKMGILQGQLDSPLSKEGKEEAIKVAPVFKKFELKHVAHSPLERAIQTAQIINEQLNLPTSEWENIKEMDFGGWQSELKYEYWDDFRNDFYVKGASPPGGESKEQLVKRSEHTVKDICNKVDESPILIVCHGMVMRMLLGEWFTNKTMKEYRQLSMPNLALYKVEVEYDAKKLNPLEYEYIDVFA